MASVKAAPVPTGLAEHGRALWREISTQVASDGCTLDARERAWLGLACAEADQLARVEAQLISSDLVVKGSMGQPVANGLLAEATRCRQVVAGMLARIALEDPSEAAVGRGGRTTSTQARRAAMARHRLVS